MYNTLFNSSEQLYKGYLFGPLNPNPQIPSPRLRLLLVIRALLSDPLIFSLCSSKT